MDTTKKLPRVLSLCTGYGGLEKGIEAIVGKCTLLVALEVEVFAITNLVNKMETGKLGSVPIWTDITTFNAKIFRGSVDILTAGFPCQPFSCAGAKNGTEDPRHLWPYIEKTILLCRPETVFLENVEGIISTKTIHHRSELCEYCEQAERRLGKTWGAFIRKRFTKYFGISVLKYVKWRLERLGYRCESGIFSAVEVGAPHQRKRVFILAESANQRFQKLRPTRVGELQEEEREGMDNRFEQQGDGILANSGRSGSEQPRSQQSKKFNIDAQELGNSKSNDKRRMPISTMHGKGGEIRGSSGNVADSGNERLQKCRDERKLPEAEKETCSTASGSRYQWPARPGQEQYEWEEPRTVGDSTNEGPQKRTSRQMEESKRKEQELERSNESDQRKTQPKLGRTIDGSRNRVDRLRLLGNGVVWQTAAKAYFVLSEKLNIRGIMINQEDHKKRHIELHKNFDELLADFITNNKGLFLDRPIRDLVTWSHKQTIKLDHELITPQD